MAETALTPTDLDIDTNLELIDGGTFQGTAADGTNGNSFAHAGGGLYVLFVENTNAAAKTPTIDSQTASDQGDDNDISQAVAQNDLWVIGPFNADRFKDGNGNVIISYDDATDVKVLVVRIKFA